MGGPNKMLAEIGGKPLVRIAAEQALASHAQPVIVVTGHEREKVEAALKGLTSAWCITRITRRDSARRSKLASVPYPKKPMGQWCALATCRRSTQL